MKAIAAAFAVWASAALVAFPTVAVATGRDTSPTTMYNSERKELALRTLREEGLKLRAADGGKLTDVHRAYLQAKRKAIMAGNY